MKAVALAALLALSGGPVMAVQIEDAPFGKRPACPLKIEFTSFGPGIDVAVYRAIRARLETADDIARVVVAQWGREGERDVCVFPKPGAERAVAARLRALIPARPAKGQVRLVEGKAD